ncbi:unnamed protein product [Medioppia subpectinata]|uniref:tRNA-guanine(15) transglycosylase-like domain-containing protein n=1 Tax=Medioppia subpectinata TaxID=1979941 RepID=A0A7R9L1C9_9ACAR|nr:unnamed protein product [Medioppia subpectinata]CAG2113458.1 unnamed protein product [Medioppia subpectinata]
MKFMVRKECLNRSRLGSLLFDALHNETNVKTTAEYPTPLCLQYTMNGSVPHIVSDLLDQLNDDNSPFLIPLPTTYLMNESLRQFNSAFNGVKSGIVDFAGLKKWRPSIVSVYDPLLAINGGHNTVEGIGVFCRGGKQTVNSSKLIDVVTNFKPDAYQAICDSDTPSNASNKRGLNPRARTKSAKESAAKTLVDGFVIDGFHAYGSQSDTQLDFVSVKPILHEIMEILPKDKPKILLGALSPKLIIKLIDSGIDVFDSSYASVMTEKGFALQEVIDVNGLKVKENSLDLNSKQFKEDFGVIETHCQCYTCVNGFSRAYINHLLNASEMLAKVLLMFHNLHTFYHFFAQIRRLLDEDSFQQLLR